MAEAYIVDAYRRPRGRGKAGKGSRSGLHPRELLGQVLWGTLERLLTRCLGGGQGIVLILERA